MTEAKQRAVAPDGAVSSPSTPPPPWDRAGRPALTGNWWARGLWSVERLEAAGQPPRLSPDPPDHGSLGWRAQRRLGRWRAAFPELAEDTAAAQARALGIDVEMLNRLLAESPEHLAARAVKPAWAQFVERVVGGWSVSAADDDGGGDDDDAGEQRPEDAWFRGFASVVAAFLAEARRILLASPALADPANRAVFDAGALAGRLTRTLRHHLVYLLARVLVLELNVARVSDRLTGETPEARFDSFVAWQREPENLAALLDEYAVAARLLACVTVNTADAYAEFAQRFVRDRPAIVRELFGGADPGPLTEVRMGEGDAHEACRTVAVLRFDSGARLVYKPRPLAVHEHFNGLVDWLNAALPELELRTVGVLDRGGYGWIEFVQAQPCADRAAAERFYRRQGALLALLYVLSATDFHFENVIAVGDQPVVVDLETLFHPDTGMLTGSPLFDEDPARAALGLSVQRVGLLPSVLIGEEGGALDLGGMGGDRGGMLPFKSPAWAGGGTDEMRLARVRESFRGSDNRPTMDGRTLDPADYLSALRAGFRAGYEVIARRRAEFTAPGGLLERFAADTVRVLIRATQTYSRLLHESTHPDVARDALDRDRVLGLLYARSAHSPGHAPILRAESLDLWAGDIPLLRGRVGSRDLHTCRGDAIADVLAESGLDRSRRIIGALGDEDLAVQDWVIQAAFATRATDLGLGRRSPESDIEAAPTADDECVELATRQARLVAESLLARAHRAGDRLGWLGLDVVREDQWRISTLADDLYGGCGGLALFFAQLARVTGEERYADVARRVLAPFPAHLAAFAPLAVERNWGAFDGLAGVAYALDGAAVLLADPDLAAPVPELFTQATREIGEDGQFDLLNGAAGALAVAEALVSRHGAPAADLAARCAALLVERAEEQPDGPAGALGWPSRMSERTLFGMSHGVGGIGWALLRHAARTGDAAAQRVGRAALGYENAAFDPSVCNWPDLRPVTSRPWRTATPSDSVQHMHAWCHGAPGIGLLRADLPVGVRDPQDEQALRRAVRSTAAVGSVGNDSLCHGDLGNLELFAAAARAGIPEAAEAYRSARAAVLRRVERGGPVCGTPDSIRTPGLLTGLAGIGHGLLRIAAPDLVAPVLLLAPHGRP